MAQYNHVQGGSSATWTITHSLNSDNVCVDVMINDGPNSPSADKIIVAVEEVTDNQLTVTFSQAHTGFARVVA